MGRLGSCMVAPVPIHCMNVCEWVNVICCVKSALSGLKTRKVLYKYSPFTIQFSLTEESEFNPKLTSMKWLSKLYK